MWTMGYPDGAEFNNIQDPFTGPKLRPLMPRPLATAAAPPPPYLTRIYGGADGLALNHHLAAATELNKRGLISTQQVVVSSRWNPTPEQLQTLEDLYRRGTRSPSNEQIQHITAQLRRYGKIEGKNVFYWFQNHKARERQKRRRQLKSLFDDEQHIAHNYLNESREKLTELPAGANGTLEQTKIWASPTNSSTVAQRSAAAKGAETECKADGGWAQFKYGAELLQRQSRNATWQTMHLSCSSSSTTPNNLLTTITSTAAAAAPLPPIAVTSTLPSNPHDHNILLEPSIPQNLGDDSEEPQTLQLFPLQSSCRNQCVKDGCAHEDEKESAGEYMNSTANDFVAPYQFFDFLPMKY